MDRPLRSFLAALGIGVLMGWIVAVVEGLVLAALGVQEPRSVLEWLHAAWLGGIVGAALAALLGLSVAAVLALSGLHGSKVRWVLVASVVGLTLIYGGYWLWSWESWPGLSSPVGASITALLVLLLLTATIGLSTRLRRLELPHSRRFAFMSGLLGAICILPMGFLPPPLQQIEMESDEDGAATSPPVFVIMIDTLRRDHLGVYGYPLPTSPNIDRLASQSIVFSGSSTTGNYTLPSTATLFTGLFPSSHGVIGPGKPLPEASISLPELFQAAGYRTAAVVANPLVRADLGFGRGFEFFSPAPPPRWIYHRKTAVELLYLRFVRGKITWGSAEELVPIALDWLDRESSRPPFLYLHLIEPHSEYAPPRHHAEPFLQAEPETWKMKPPLIENFRSPDEWQTWSEVIDRPVIPDDERRAMIGLYDGEIHHVDHWIGNFLQGLEQRRLLDQAVVVLAADHGEEFDDHGGWVHGNTLYEEMIGMPLLLKLPRGLGAGTRSPLSIDMVDLRSTLTGLARIDAPSDHGIDYSDEIESLMADPPAPIHAYSERPPYLYALRVGDWKIIRRDRRDSTSWQLYNLRRDPQELMDLAESEPETLARLMTELEGAMRSAGNLSWDAADSLPELDPEAERDLRALGYIQ